MAILTQSNLSYRRLRRTTVWQLSRPKPIWNFYDKYKEDFSNSRSQVQTGFGNIAKGRRQRAEGFYAEGLLLVPGCLSR